MKVSYNLNNKRFALIDNSDNGEVDASTIFEYQQNENIVTAKYYGGTVKYGKIIAVLKEDQLDMLYQCVTVEDELKAGKAIANITTTSSGKIKLSLNWQWLTEKGDNGTSEYVEI